MSNKNEDAVDVLISIKQFSIILIRKGLSFKIHLLNFLQISGMPVFLVLGEIGFISAKKSTFWAHLRNDLEMKEILFQMSSDSYGGELYTITSSGFNISKLNAIHK